MIKISALDEPLPGTEFVRVEWSPQAVHERTALASASIEFHGLLLVSAVVKG